MVLKSHRFNAQKVVITKNYFLFNSVVLCLIVVVVGYISVLKAHRQRKLRKTFNGDEHFKANASKWGLLHRPCLPLIFILFTWTSCSISGSARKN